MIIGNYREGHELKKAALEQLKGKWLQAVLICFIAWLLRDAFSSGNMGGQAVHYTNINGEFTRISSDPNPFKTIGGIINFLLGGAISFGVAGFFLKLVRDENPMIENLFNGFSYFVKTFLVYLITTIFTVLWTLLLIVPGIIAAFRYSMVYFIMNDNPEIGVMDAINLSKEMMKGHKGRLFSLWISFIGWFILGLIPLGIGLLWVIPYYNSAKANFYEDLKINYNNDQNQIGYQN